MSGFRQTLSELASAQEKPIVIFVDELDRCRPEFAVKLIERIKHLFEMPNVVFVLLLNRDQLCKAIKGVYGSEIDAGRYLSKFIHLSLTLPKSYNISSTGQSHSFIYCHEVMKRFGHSSNEVAEELGAWATLSGMSLRDIERAVGLLSLSSIQAKLRVWLCWPIVLKIIDSEIFSGVLKGDVAANATCIKHLERFEQKLSEGRFVELHTDKWKAMHSACINYSDENHLRDMNQLVSQVFAQFRPLPAKEWLLRFFESVDLSTK